MLDRRTFVCLFASGAALAVTPRIWVNRALAQTSLAQAQGWRALPEGPRAAFVELAGRAVNLTGGRSLAADLPPTDDYAELFPRLLELMDTLPPDGAAGGELVLADASELLGAITALERSPEVEGEFEEDGRAIKAPSFEVLKDEYVTLFNSCEIRPERANAVKAIVAAMLKPERRSQYEDVQKRLEAEVNHPSIPWYFVGAVHSLEAGFNFKGHLHNGDPLRAKTFQVPANRPDPWNPPTDWASSAIDALKLKNYHLITEWTLPRLLYSFERYNGFGNRLRRDENGKPINTPYLWSFSQHYSKGKYVKDRVWSPTAVSKQCGAAVILKELIAQGVIQPPVSG